MSPLRIDYRWMLLIWLGLATVATFAAMAHAVLGTDPVDDDLT